MQTQSTNTVNTRKNALFSYENSQGEPAFFTHAELVALRKAYTKQFPDMKDDVFEDDSLFDANGDSDLRQQMADWNEDR